MTGAHVEQIHKDLQALAASMGRWMTASSGGSQAANQQLAAEYLIDLFAASRDGDSVTDHLTSGVTAYKEIRLAMQDLGVDR